MEIAMDVFDELLNQKASAIVDEAQTKFMDGLLTHLNKNIGTSYVLPTKSPAEIIEQIVTYYESIIGCMPGNVYWLDNRGVTLGCNENVLAMFGFVNVKLKSFDSW